ncbi:MAG: formylglycine-generating enzyme family protein [Candidatus Delongbacteria bacterium]|nr:formylglycine-generating enzyme family protein [Candidatus Delongbacteria bacterium]MBN2834509.1 formylglycine-generating enzyme family protein [Candidatus Delongbacteria bacterium]
MRILKLYILIIILLILSCGWSDKKDITSPENGAPIISSLSLSNDSVYTGYSVTLVCDAYDPDGDKIEYKWIYTNGTVIGQGYIVQWESPDETGIYSIQCRVTDENGASNLKTRNIKVISANPPVCNLVLPADSLILNYNDNFLFHFEATDPDGTVDSLKIYVDDIYNTSLKEEYTLTVNASQFSSGEHSYYGIAVDNLGAETKSETRKFFIRENPNVIEMMPVARGTFLMGSENGNPNEVPVHVVSLTNDAYFSRTEITVNQMCIYLNYAFNNSMLSPPDESGKVYNTTGLSKTLLSISDQIVFNDNSFLPVPGKENYPVIDISWFGAAFFCNLISMHENRNTLYNLSDWSCNVYSSQSSGYRLPTEAEWEYSVKIPGDRIYPWGNSEPDQSFAVYQTEKIKSVMSCSPKGDSFYGVSDLSGNAREWINDSYGLYNATIQTNPEGASASNLKVVRGGSWQSTGSYLKATTRDFLEPAVIDNKTGFRVLLYIP